MCKTTFQNSNYFTNIIMCKIMIYFHLESTNQHNFFISNTIPKELNPHKHVIIPSIHKESVNYCFLPLKVYSNKQIICFGFSLCITLSYK